MNKKTIVSASKKTILKLKVLAKEKEEVRRKLAIVAKELRLKAKQLALTAKEKETIRTKLAVTAEKLKLKAEELEIAIIKTNAILDSIGDAVMACDKDGQVILFNRKAVSMTGFSAKEVIGKHYNDVVKFVREVDGKPSKDFIAEAMKTGHKTTMADDTLLLRKDGLKIPVADSAEPIRYTKGILIGCVIVFRDVTREKETDKAKSEFISVASHQLKTPVTIVNLYTEMLLDGRNGDITEKQKEYITEIRSANQRMIELITTLLNVSRIEMGIFPADPMPVDAIAIFKNAVKDAQKNLEAKKLVVKEKYHRAKHMIPVDPLLLNMIFSNLLSNSIKYTPSGGNISIETVEAQKGERLHNHVMRENKLLISVSDNGCGIPTGEQDKIFTKFFRSDNARREHTDGTGLGLYIIKSILDHIGGSVWFSSKENEGSQFYFTIPLNNLKI